MQKKIIFDFEKSKKAARTLSIITHPIRKKMIEMIAENKEMNVTQIYTKLNLIQAETSLHLILMKDHGILKKVRRGKMSIYSVNEELINYIIQISNDLSKR